MSFLLYLAVALLLLWIAHRTLMPLSRAVALLLILLPMCVTGKALLTGGVFGPVDLPYFTEPLRDMRVPLGVAKAHNGMLSDLYAQMIPWRKAVQFAISHGRWPLWNPFILSGTQLAAAAQPAAYSPFTLIACLLPVAHSITFSAALTFFLAGLGAFLFARELGCRQSVALCAAAGWMYAGGMAFFVLWSLGSSWALLPMVFFATRRCVHAPGIRSAAILMTILTLLLLAGHPETAFHIVFCGAIYGLVELLAIRRHVPRVLITVVAAGGIALLLSAIYLLPMFEAAPQTMEQQFRMGGYRDVPRGVASGESAARILTDFFPHLHGRWWMRKVPHWVPLETSAAGSIVVALAAYALVRVRRRRGRSFEAETVAEPWATNAAGRARRETTFFGALALFGILCGAGWSPLAALMQKLPLFDIALNERFTFAAAFSLVILACLGLEHALATRDKSLGYTLAAATIIFAVGAFAIDRLHVMEDKLPEWGVYTLFGELACLGIAAAAVLALKNRDRAIPITLFLLIAAQRWLAGHDIYPTLPAYAAYPPVPILRSLPRETGPPFRIVGRAHALVPGTSALYELEDVRGYEAMTFSRYVATYEAWCTHQPVWFNRVDDLTKPFLSMLNVRYAIASANVAPPDGWRRVALQRGAQLLENTRVFPRAFMPSHVVFGTPFDGIIKAMTAAPDFHERAWIEAPLTAGERANDGGTVAAVIRDGGDLLIDTATAAGAWVVITEPAWDGWRIYIDDRRVEHFYANAAFIGVYVPSGGHRIRLTFLPKSFVQGRAISLSTLALLLGGAIAVKIRRHRVTPE
jgi:hypothetical protein